MPRRGQAVSLAYNALGRLAVGVYLFEFGD